MLSFKQFLNETWHASMKCPYQKSMPGDFDIYKNPSKSELMKEIHASEAKQVRGIFHGDDIYIFDAMRATHYDVNDHLKLGSKRTNYITIGKERWGSEYVDSDETLHRIKNHPWIKKTIPNHRFFHG